MSLRPGDEVHPQDEFIETRPSNPDRGIVTVRLSLVRSDEEVVMSHCDMILVRRRDPLDRTPRSAGGARVHVRACVPLRNRSTGSVMKWEPSGHRSPSRHAGSCRFPIRLQPTRS